MKRLLFSVFSLIFFFLISSINNSSFAYSDQKPLDRIIIKFKPNISTTLKKGFFGYHKLSPEQLKLKDTYVVKVPQGELQSLITLFLKNGIIQYAEPDFVADATEIPNDPYYSNQWGLSKIKSSSSWDTTHGLDIAYIAIVDTGVDSSHPDISGKVIKSADCTGSSCVSLISSSDNNGHGTHVAGIAAASTNNSIGVAGESYNSNIISVKVLDSSGSGYYSWVSNGIVWAADNGAKVINLSLGGTSSSTTLQNAISYAWNKGVLIAAAAGNNNSSRKFYPAYYSNVVSVAATDQNDAKASFSNYGSWVTLAAPGVSIYSTYKGSYDYLSGTSMATPFVSGLAGLVFGEHPDWTNSKVKDQIQTTADKISGTGKYWIYGRINSCSAVGCSTVVSSPTPTTAVSSPTPTLTTVPTLTPTSVPPSLTPTPVPFTPTPTQTQTPTPTPIPWWCSVFPGLCK